jgi:hypothetical protein
MTIGSVLKSHLPAAQLNLAVGRMTDSYQTMASGPLLRIGASSIRTGFVSGVNRRHRIGIPDPSRMIHPNFSF